MLEILFYSITAMLYLALAIFAWLKAPQPRTFPESPTVAEGQSVWRRVLLPMALMSHAFLLARDMTSETGLNLNLGTALSLIAWLTVAIYWVESHWVRVGALQNLVLPIAAICVTLPYFMNEQHVLSYAGMNLFKAHLVISIVGYGLLTVAALHALLLWVLERGLRHKGRLPTLLSDLPPLMALERLTFRILFAGFVLLTLTLLSGLFFSEALFGKPFKFSHHMIFGFIAWSIFFLLLLGRHFWGWRGQSAVRWLLSGFGFLVLAYLGSKFVLEVILHRY